MQTHDWRARQFEDHRPHLRSVAYRMLGSLSEADDAVQDTWLRVQRSDTSEVENIGGWLTTITARVCLDILRSRTSRREASLDEQPGEPAASNTDGVDPEHEALMADAVGLALMVVLEKLAPAERVAFVMHDVFAVPFDEIAPILERSPAATRQLASRARRRVQGADVESQPDVSSQREVIDAFLAAARNGDFAALLEFLDPDVTLRTDRLLLQDGKPAEIHGAQGVAENAIKAGARAAQSALINGAAGVIIAPAGRLKIVLSFTFEGRTIVGVEAIADPERLSQLDLAMFAT